MLILKLCLLRYLLLGQLFFAGLAVYFYRCKREMPLAPVYSSPVQQIIWAFKQICYELRSVVLCF